MGNLFPDGDEYPDYRPLPRMTLSPEFQSLMVPVAGLAIAVTFVGLYPAHEDRPHLPHQDHSVDLTYTRGLAIASTGGSSSITPGTGELMFTGYAPKALIAPSR